MANQTYVSGSVSVGTSATLIASPSGPGSILVSIPASSTVYFGGAGVTKSTGFEVATGTAATTGVTTITLELPTQGPAHDLWGVASTGTVEVSFIYPAGD